MQFDSIDFTVATHFLSALINGDETGLDDDESAQLGDFMDFVMVSAPVGYQFAHFSYESDEEGNFAQCDICQMQADCATLTAMYSKA